MKLQTPYKFVFILLLCLPWLAIANNELKSTSEKTISKTFNVNSTATLRVSNSFGNITVITTNQDYISFDISIKVSGNNKEKQDERLNDISIDFSADTDLVTALTKIKKPRTNWWNWGKSTNSKLEIDYLIKLPITNNVELENKFGNITLDQLKGTSKIVCEHGKVQTKELLSENNVITLNHTRGNYFDYINNGQIEATHSGITIAKLKQINLKAEHTQTHIEAAESVFFKCAFGALKIDDVNNVEGLSEHLTTRINTLYRKAALETSHGTLKISKITDKVKSVAIHSEFTSLSLGYDPTWHFSFNFSLEFSSLRDAEGLQFSNKIIDSFNKLYKGYYGTENSGNTMQINTEHGSISLLKTNK